MPTTPPRPRRPAAKKKTEPVVNTPPVIPVEDVESELTNNTDTPRKVRVYAAHGSDDFVIELPPGCRMTFGYFNPGQPANEDGYRRGRQQEERRTALRVYQGAGNGNQLAAFLGVKGFRDESITLKKIVEKVTIERRLVDDGEGNQEYGGKREVELRAITEGGDFS